MDTISSFTHKTKKVLKLIEAISIPKYQRYTDQEHVNEIFEYNQNYYEEHSKFNILGSISLGILSDSDKYEIIDGCHRIQAYKLLAEKYGDFSVGVDIYERDTEEELMDIHYRMNLCKPVPILTKNAYQTCILNSVQKLFKDKWKSFISTANKPIKANINIDALYKALVVSNIIEKCNITEGQQLMDYIIELNTYFKSLPQHVLVSKAEKGGFEIKSDEFIIGSFRQFEWIDFIIIHIVEKIEYRKMTFKSINSKEKVPKKIRIQLWKDNFENNTNGICYVCEEKITINDFEAGHIKSKFHGGTNELDNLKVICSTCNKDCGIFDLDEYKKNFK